MPKPKQHAREARRAARDLARRHAIEAVGRIAYISPLIAEPSAYLAEIERIVDRMRGQYRLRAEPAHGGTAPAAEPFSVKPVRVKPVPE